MSWYESKHVVVTGPSLLTRCVWRVFIDVFAKGANLIPPCSLFHSVPAHRFAPSLSSLPPPPPIPCYRTSTFRAIIFYTLKMEAKIPPKWYLYTKLHGVTSSRNLWTERSVLSQETDCFRVQANRCQPKLRQFWGIRSGESESYVVVFCAPSSRVCCKTFQDRAVT